MIIIHKPGLLTTVQDLGRYGFQKYGVIVSGPMDAWAHRIANLLVGNDENDPTLELTLQGAAIEFHQDSLIAICGGNLSPEVNGRTVKLWRPVFVKKGAILRFGAPKSGCRAYLAVAGSFDIPLVMKSTSTYLRAEMGGFNGRALKADDQIPFRPLSKLSSLIFHSFKIAHLTGSMAEADWTIASDLLPNYPKNPDIRIMEGRQFHLFNSESQSLLYTEPFIVTPQSDRMGFRLKGPALSLGKPEEMITEAVCFGTIQVPSEGNPIVLLADRQTTGGYPKIAQIAACDFPLIAQTKPGDSIRFRRISYSEAQGLFLEKEKKLRLLKLGIALKYR